MDGFAQLDRPLGRRRLEIHARNQIPADEIDVAADLLVTKHDMHRCETLHVGRTACAVNGTPA